MPRIKFEISEDERACIRSMVQSYGVSRFARLMKIGESQMSTIINGIRGGSVSRERWEKIKKKLSKLYKINL